MSEMTVAVSAVPIVADLAGFGDRVAVITADGEMSYAALAARVEAFADRLGGQRRLVLVPAKNTIDSLVAYLGCLRGGHVALMAGDDADTLIRTYDPDVVVGDGCRLQERRNGTAHTLHPELALLLSTSGSTGSAKLVRLSRENLQSNAESIARYLAIDDRDRAATTLPMQYCYGLSVFNSHLVRGASLLLTDLSVADARFWELFHAKRCTSFAGVPYTFDLLDRLGFENLSLPDLRYVTQAGGRLAPERVQRYARLGRRDGWDFVVMYGQTEATARMAYLPPELAVDYPHCIGVPIPGGALEVDPLPDWPGDDTGELVYSGPNVMLGYAESADDLSLGRTVEQLRTGDIARRNPAGLFEVIGRRSRFAKIFGLRVDLQQLETNLESHGVTALCAGDDDRLTVVAQGSHDEARVRELAAAACRLPLHVIDVVTVEALPRLPSGKLDYQAAGGLKPAQPGTLPANHDTDLLPLYAEILGKPDAKPSSTFVGLGGDSLSYVELSVRLEAALGHLPKDWHTTPIQSLRPVPRKPSPNRKAAMDTSVALRAAAIVLIVSTHASFLTIAGGAHVLLAVAGFNLARFHLTAAQWSDRLRGMGRSIRRIALASMTWIALAAIFFSDAYKTAQVLLVNNLFGHKGIFNDFWFIEAIVYILLAVLALMAIPQLDRAERRWPFALPLLLTSAALITRYQLIPGVKLATPIVVFWLFTLGWAAAKATTVTQRAVVSMAGLATIPGFHGDLAREAVMLAGLLVLIWVPAMPSTPVINRVAGLLAGASLYIYLTHWQIVPRLDDRSALLAVGVSLAVGIGYGALARRVGSFVRTGSRRTAAALKQSLPG